MPEICNQPLTADRVDLSTGVVVFASLKKRQPGIFRAVPVPPTLLEALNLVHRIREHSAARAGPSRSLPAQALTASQW